MNWKTFPYTTFCSLVFFLIGYLTGQWDKAWLIWLTIPIFNSFAQKNKTKEPHENSTESWSDY